MSLEEKRSEQQENQVVMQNKYYSIKYRPQNPMLAVKCSSLLRYLQEVEDRFGENAQLPESYVDLINKGVSDAIKECKTEDDLKELEKFLEEVEQFLLLRTVLRHT